MENKTFHSFLTKAGDQGMVEAIVAVMGNVDDGGDVIHPGAFTKTITERLGKIKVLDAHRYDSTMRIVGKPLEMREMTKAELPAELLQRYPDAVGGLWTKTQFLLDTPEGEGVFKRIKAGALDEWSIGYDALDADYSKITKEGKEVTVRNLRTCRLYEYSPVLWGMNSATSTLGAKAAEPTEGKPYGAIQEGEVWRVYKLDDEGDPSGEPLGEHEDEESAQAQVRALYASEDESKAAMRSEEDGEHPAGHYLVVEDPEKPSTWHLRVRGLDGKPDHRLMGAAWAALHGGYRGNSYEGPGKDEAIRKLAALYESEELDVPGKSAKAGRILAARNAKRILDAMELLKEALADAGLLDDAGDEPGEDAACDEEDERKPKKETRTTGAGPLDEAPTLLKLIDVELKQIDLLEV